MIGTTSRTIPKFGAAKVIVHRKSVVVEVKIALVLAIGGGLLREKAKKAKDKLTVATATQSPIVKREPHTHAQSTLPGDWTSSLDNSYHLYTTSPAPPQSILMQVPDPRQGHTSYHQADTAAPAMHRNNSHARRESSSPSGVSLLPLYPLPPLVVCCATSPCYFGPLGALSANSNPLHNM